MNRLATEGDPPGSTNWVVQFSLFVNVFVVWWCWDWISIVRESLAWWIIIYNCVVAKIAWIFVWLGMRGHAGMRDEIICIIYVDWYSVEYQEWNGS